MLEEAGGGSAHGSRRAGVGVDEPRPFGSSRRPAPKLSPSSSSSSPRGRARPTRTRSRRRCSASRRAGGGASRAGCSSRRTRRWRGARGTSPARRGRSGRIRRWPRRAFRRGTRSPQRPASTRCPSGRRLGAGRVRDLGAVEDELGHHQARLWSQGKLQPRRPGMTWSGRMTLARTLTLMATSTMRPKRSCKKSSPK